MNPSLKTLRGAKILVTGGAGMIHHPSGGRPWRPGDYFGRKAVPGTEVRQIEWLVDRYFVETLGLYQ